MAAVDVFVSLELSRSSLIIYICAMPTVQSQAFVESFLCMVI